MTETPISVEELLKKYNIQPHDLEYILNFMQKENISPQLAMRRIKLFEKLQEKMEQAQSDDKVKELTSELDHLSKVVEDLQTEKAELDKEIEETRLQQDLFNAEREELKMQMHALMDSIDTIESEAGEGGEQLQAENQDLKKKISMMTASAQTLKERILQVGSETPNLQPLIQDIEKSLVAVIEARQIPTDTAFSVSGDAVVAETRPGTTPIKKEISAVADANETISPDQAKFVSAPPTAEATEPVEPEKKAPIVVATPPSTSMPVIKEKIFDEPEEVEEPAPSEEPVVETKPTPKPESKPAPKPEPELIEEPKKVKVDAKPTTDGKEVSAKIEKILRLFISYAGQADSDENWKARIAAICDMDEAYIELGGLAMSQIYAYQTQSLKKKKEFERLITSWIENGLPR